MILIFTFFRMYVGSPKRRVAYIHGGHIYWSDERKTHIARKLFQLAFYSMS
jgi:hypothetical protein